MTEFNMTQEQYQQLLDVIQHSRMEIAEVKGAINAFSGGLAAEVNARQALGQKLDAYDSILRGDGRGQRGLIEVTNELLATAERNAANIVTNARSERDAIEDVNKRIDGIRRAAWGLAAAILAPVLVDIILRLLPLVYKGAP